MRRDLYHINVESISFGLINHPVLLIEKARAIAFPFSSKRLVPKTSDEHQSSRAGYLYDILPFLVALLDFHWRLGQLLAPSPMFIYRPHTINSIYTVYGM
jgi:hypothetical protein